MGVLVLVTALFAATAGIEHRELDLERENLGTASSFRPTSQPAANVMDRLLCQCPGCQAKHITIADCACGYAARQRREVLAIITEYDLATAGGRDRAEAAAIADQVRRYGQQVLSEPDRATVWLLPIGACLAGLGLVLARGRRRREPAASLEISLDPELDERLDDDLAELD